MSPVKTRHRSSDAKSTGDSPIPLTSSCKPAKAACIFCEEVRNKTELRRAATLFLERKVKECAEIVGDKRLLTQLAAGDMVAIDAVYHHAFVTKLSRRAETIGCHMTETNETRVIRAHVLNELLDFIEDYDGSGESLLMAKLTTLYDKQTAAWVFSDIKCHTTHLCKDIERLIADIKSVQTKHSWSLVYDDDLSKAIVEM